ncbi:ASST-domain-containing protein [Exophiala viscosa]|uniref:ASST-domain-containing protein n=1 Tax=Exophiala viscosa TaxID=2486360 RepID=A0AAN6IDG8_9EURO|nr:ASST-domain-containing protein [Exophiala viscosa]
MRSSLLFAALFLSWVGAFSFNTYDLGFHGLYPRQHFHTVDFEPPAPKITRWDSRCDSGNLLLTPRGPSVRGSARGPVMLDARGNLIWMDNDNFEQAMNLDLNSSYEVAHRIHPHGKGLKADSHEFRLTPHGTALITIYYKHKADCTDLGLGKTCWIQDGVFQEIDIETGDLLFEWRATDHIRMSDVFSKPCRKDGYGKSKKDAFDFFHINSIDKMDSGDYLISARYSHAVMCISSKTGEILWQLGGKNDSFEDLDHATDFAWQHHARWLGNKTISLFDNHANSVFHGTNQHSKGMIIRLDMEKMTTSLVQKYVHPDKILNVSQGSVQVIANSSNVLVGFGNSPTYVEYSAGGEVLCSAHFAPHLAFELVDFGLVKSYRVFKSPWVGRPKTLPVAKVRKSKVYVSWNGATEVTSWRLETSKTRDVKDDEFVTIQELERDGFETSFAIDKNHRYVRVAALDAEKVVLAHSSVLRAPSPSSIAVRLIQTLFVCMVVLLLGFAGFISLYARSPRLPGLPQFGELCKVRARLHRAAQGDGEDEDFETEPLLMGTREP